MGTAEYETYLAGPVWKRLRNEVLSSREWRCAVCGTHNSKSPLEVHHCRYDRLGKTGELRDVIPVCEACHHKIHEWRGDLPPDTDARARVEQVGMEKDGRVEEPEGREVE